MKLDHVKQYLSKSIVWYFFYNAGHVEIARILIEKGADVSEDIDYVGTPLHSAVTLGHLDVARLLIEKGADVNAVNNDYDSYRTPLHMAVVGQSLTVKSILEYKQIFNQFSFTIQVAR